MRKFEICYFGSPYSVILLNSSCFLVIRLTTNLKTFCSEGNEHVTQVWRHLSSSKFTKSEQ